MSRAEMAERVFELRDQGLTYRMIAKSMNLSVSMIRDYIYDPDGTKGRALKDSYRGTCKGCGARTSGSNGRSLAPEYCIACWNAEQAKNRKWTAEVVIDAIQRFAADHGRPPTANEWITADPDRGYPPRSSVYISNKRERASQPFASWADAIEAAGFERPSTGRRTFKEGTMTNKAPAGYVVLHRNAPDDGWRVVSESKAHSQVLALNEALNGSAPTGEWIAVPGRYWRPRNLIAKTIYDWAE